MECQIIPNIFKNNTNVFKVPSSFMFVVLKVSTGMPILIGKLGVPEMKEREAEEPKFCKIPYIKNGYVVDMLFDDTLSLGENFPDEETKVKVVCEDGFYLDHDPIITCTKRGWSNDFPKCHSK